MRNIFPKEILESTAQVHKFKHSKKSSIIYSIFLVVLVGIFIALPFIKVDVYSSSRGIIKSDKSPIKLVTIYPGKVLKNYIEINKQVSKGDTLLILDNYVVLNNLALLKINIAELERFKHDIVYLLNNDFVNIDSIYTQKYQKEYFQFREKIQELQTRSQKAKLDYLRNQQLFEKEIIAAVEFEKFKFEYDLILNSRSQLKTLQLNNWQRDLITKTTKLNELENRVKLQNEKKKDYVLTAPIDGSLMNVIGIEQGSTLGAGIPLAQISPDGDLIAECYVSPIDIGLINKRNIVKFQIDTYNYNQWGHATGRIIEIGKDIELLNETPVFKVRCKVDQEYLTLKNGFQGMLKKGMTFNVRFNLTERTLFQLLNDKLNDWLNPSNQIE